MKNSSRKVFAAAAMAGLLGGTALRQSYADGTSPSTNGQINIAPGKVAPLKKSPKLHDCSGMNDCKGIGGCKTDEHACKFKNACKGKGGCEITKKDIQDWAKKQKAAAKPLPSTNSPVKL